MRHKSGKIIVITCFLVLITIFEFGCTNQCWFCGDRDNTNYDYSYSFTGFVDLNGNRSYDQGETLVGGVDLEIIRNNQTVESISLENGRGYHDYRGKLPPALSFNVKSPPPPYTFLRIDSYEDNYYLENCCGTDSRSRVDVFVIFELPKARATLTPTPTPTATPTPLPCSILAQPEDGKEFGANGYVTFAWTETTGADRYELEITQPSGLLFTKSVKENYYHLWLENLPLGGEYQWRVLPYTYAGVLICSSESFTFYKDALPPSKDKSDKDDKESKCPPFYQDGDICYYTPEP